ncbi:MAG TPA: type IV pilin protein [Pseudomonadota bacterium]|nr:type IV pilin protein [Pseudomonadota bacterium]
MNDSIASTRKNWRSKCSPASHRAGGFTLLELMIVVSIIAILAAIAYPSFMEQVVKTRRKAATGCLMEAAQFMERYYTTRLTYVGADPALACETDIADSYVIAAPTGLTATAYSLTVVPQGSQATHDTKCGTLGIDQAGIRTKSGTASAVSDCWG